MSGTCQKGHLILLSFLKKLATSKFSEQSFNNDGMISTKIKIKTVLYLDVFCNVELIWAPKYYAQIF